MVLTFFFCFFFFLESTMSTRQMRSSREFLDLFSRVDMVVSKKKKKVSTVMPKEKCGCTGCLRLFSSPRVQPNLGFSLVQVILALNLFENRSFTVFFWCTEQINLLFIISDDSILEQISFPTTFQCELSSTTEVCHLPTNNNI